jgi:hypothetical protein
VHRRSPEIPEIHSFVISTLPRDARVGMHFAMHDRPADFLPRIQARC